METFRSDFQGTISDAGCSTGVVLLLTNYPGRKLESSEVIMELYMHRLLCYLVFPYSQSPQITCLYAFIK
jgi:hypothetical protein